MFRKNWRVFAPLMVMPVLLIGVAASVSQFSTWSASKVEQDSDPTAVALSKDRQAEDESPAAASPCANSLSQLAVCGAANQRALEIMNASHLEAFTVVQDVRSGALIAFAASQPSSLDVTTPVLPLSVAKLLLASSWWDNAQPNTSFDSSRGAEDTRSLTERLVSVREMLVGGNDRAGRKIAVALRQAVGTDTVLKDLKRYVFDQRSDTPRDYNFWAELAPAWTMRLAPSTVRVSLSKETNDPEWAETLSIGETNMVVTGLHLSRFLQAVGNGGVMLAPAAREERTRDRRQEQSQAAGDRSMPLKNSIRVLQESTAVRLQAAMRDCVQRGSAKSIAKSLAGTGWEIGGKTGTGPGPLPIGPQSDGWFAGLIFDAQGKARFTVATFVRHGGLGGGNAAKISAELARYIIGSNAQSSPSSKFKLFTETAGRSPAVSAQREQRGGS